MFMVLVGAVSVSAQKQYCFQNDGLKAVTEIKFSVSGNTVSDGEYTKTDYDDDSNPVKAAFTGTKAGNVLTIKFTDSTPDDFMNIKVLKWTLGETLKVQMYGKDYQTNKWTVYTATFEACESN